MSCSGEAGAMGYVPLKYLEIVTCEKEGISTWSAMTTCTLGQAIASYSQSSLWSSTQSLEGNPGDGRQTQR